MSLLILPYARSRFPNQISRGAHALDLVTWSNYSLKKKNCRFCCCFFFFACLASQGLVSVAFTSQNIVASRTKLFSRSFKLKEKQEEEAIFPGLRFHDFRSKGWRFSNMPAE